MTEEECTNWEEYKEYLEQEEYNEFWDNQYQHQIESEQDFISYSRMGV